MWLVVGVEKANIRDATRLELAEMKLKLSDMCEDLSEFQRSLLYQLRPEHRVLFLPWSILSIV